MLTKVIEFEQLKKELAIINQAVNSLHLRLKAELSRTITAGFRDYFRSKGFAVENLPNHTEATYGDYKVTLRHIKADEDFFTLEATEPLPTKYQIALRRKNSTSPSGRTGILLTDPVQKLNTDLDLAYKRKEELLNEIKASKKNFMNLF